MLIIRGVNVFPSQIEAALLEMNGTTPHYLMIVDRVNNLDTLEVQVEVEEAFFSDQIRELENLSKKIAAYHPAGNWSCGKGKTGRTKDHRTKHG